MLTHHADRVADRADAIISTYSRMYPQTHIHATRKWADSQWFDQYDLQWGSSSP